MPVRARKTTSGLMQVKCQTCGYVKGEPTASGGLGCLFSLAVPLFALEALAFAVRHTLRVHSLPHDWSRLALLGAGWLLLMFPLWFTGYAVKLRYSFVRCPRCGARKWSNGYHSGFGL